MSNDKIDNEILEGADQIDKPEQDPIISPEANAELDAEIELEEEFGDSSLRTFAESAASSASFGLSDQALTKSGLVSKEDLRERRKRNSKSAIAGEVAGVVGPALLSGGSSLLAKGAASGVATAAKAGLATEKITANVLKKIITDTGKKSIAKEVLRKGVAKGAGSAVEGSFYGAGKLISEEALGNADFNAENLISHAGTAALFGGVLGGALGATTAVIPKLKAGKITGWTTKKIKGAMSPEKNAQQLAGMSPSQIYKIKTMKPQVYAHTPKMLKQVAAKEGITAFSSNNKLFKATNKFMENQGAAIGKSLDDITSVLEAKAALPTRSAVSQRIVNSLDELTNQFKDANGKVLAGARPKVNKIMRVINDFDKDLVSSEIVTTKVINELKSKYQKLAKWDTRGNLPLEESINRQISGALREEVIDLAEKAGGELGAKLKNEMANYHTAQEFLSNFGKKIDTSSNVSFGSVRDIMLGGMFGPIGKVVAAANVFAKSDIKKRLSVLVGVEKANQSVTKKLNTKLAAFIKGTKKAAIPLTTKALVNSQFSKKYSDGSFTKKPKNNSEAFQNISKNISELATNPEMLYDSTETANIADGAPLAAQQSQMILADAVQFLFSKLPKDNRNTGVLTSLARPWEPSSIELSKFEKYVRAIENPLTLLDDLESGTVSREAVEAVKTVYPNLYERIQEKTIDEITKNPDSVTYEKRLNLGILLELPTDAALNPSNIRGLQAHFSEAEVTQAGGGAISTAKASKLDMAESQSTGAQKTANRGDK